jgi:unsaturated rhamnogalacturonyl hydrolase
MARREVPRHHYLVGMEGPFPSTKRMGTERDTTSLREIAERVYQYTIRRHNFSTDLLNPVDFNSMAWGMDIDDWEWNPGVGVNAISAYYDLCRRPDVLDYLISWIERNKHKAVKFQHVNKMVPFAIFPDMYRRTGNRYYLDTAVDYGHWILKNAIRTQPGAYQHGSDTTEQIWADTIFMVVLFLARLARLTGEKAFAEEAAQQLLLHLRHLQDPETGVLFHGYFCEEKSHKSAARWTRGNAWIVVGTPLILGEIGGMLPVPPEIIERYHRMVDGLLRFQAANGLWHTVMDHPEGYHETSGSAGFACGIFKSVRQGILGSSCLPAAERALDGVVRKIDATGAVTSVSGGTPIMKSIDEYNRLSCYPTLYGQGLTLMLLAEYLQHP